MSRSATYQIRIDEQDKKETFAVLQELGITPAQAVKMFFAQVRLTHSIPFPIEYTPNSETQKVFAETDAGLTLNSAKNVEDLFYQLDI